MSPNLSIPAPARLAILEWIAKKRVDHALMAVFAISLGHNMNVSVQSATRASTVKRRGVPIRCNVTMEDHVKLMDQSKDQPLDQSISANAQLVTQEQCVMLPRVQVFLV